MDLTNELLTRARKLNIYLIPQYSWLILLYYLMINALYKVFNFLGKNNPDFNFDLPTNLLSLNDTVMTHLQEWTPFIWFIAITLIVSGFIIAFIQYLPVLDGYDFSYRAGIGVYLGVWILLIAITIHLYDTLGGLFILSIPICFGLTELWKQKIKDYF